MIQTDIVSSHMIIINAIQQLEYISVHWPIKKTEYNWTLTFKSGLSKAAWNPPILEFTCNERWQIWRCRWYNAGDYFRISCYSFSTPFFRVLFQAPFEINNKFEEYLAQLQPALRVYDFNLIFLADCVFFLYWREYLPCEDIRLAKIFRTQFIGFIYIINSPPSLLPYTLFANELLVRFHSLKLKKNIRKYVVSYISMPCVCSNVVITITIIVLGLTGLY